MRPLKKLIFMRHGKSSWDYPVSDIDRPLQVRGIKDAQLVASEFMKFHEKIDASFSSPANRALHTGMIAMRILKIPYSNFQISNEMYDFSGNSVMEFVKKLEDNLTSVLIFGHNHALTEIVNLWGDSYIENVPTAGLVQLNFEIDTWRDISGGKTEKKLFPNQFK